MTDAPQDVGAWTDVLDALEAELDAVDVALAAGLDPAGAPWSAPRDIGPVPADLRGRARGLLTRLTTSVERLTSAREAIAAERDDLTQRRAAAAAYDAW